MPPRAKKVVDPATASITIETELQAAEETVSPDAMPIDVLGDWYEKLITLRARIEADSAEEKEAKGKIQALLEENDKSIGLINGHPVIEMTRSSARSAPSLGRLDDVAAEIGVKTSELIGELFDKLGITAGFPVNSLASVLQVAARKVLTDYTKIYERTTIETKKFLDKETQS